MSEVRLVIRDAHRDLSGTIHGSCVDRLVAAPSAEPETIEELDRAVRRFAKTDRPSFFGWIRSGINDEPHDAGVVVIDLAARLVAYKSTYSYLSKEGSVCYHDGRCATDVHIHYVLSDDWQIDSHIEGWEVAARKRRAQRAAEPPLDARAVLYGRPLLEHIARGCYAACIEASEAPTEQLDDCIRRIHADWLLTSREDLRGQSPREVMFARKEFVGFDLNSRSAQWSQLDECPPILSRDSNAYRYAGFGTHEMVKYYDLVRELLWSCCDSAMAAREQARRDCLAVGDFLVKELPRLELLREALLDAPDEECHNRTVRSIIDNERLRRPEGVTVREAMIDPDCPCCQMMADMPGPVFWHLDGCNMDEDFAFNIYHETLEEWEEEQREYAESARRYEERRSERERLGVTPPAEGYYYDAGSAWKRSFVASDTNSAPLPIRLFAIGTFLSELTVDIKDAGGERALIDSLSRDYGNLREVLQPRNVSLAQSLAEPVLDRFCQTLSEVAAAHEELQEKCDDLQQRLRRFLEPPSEPAADDFWSGDDDDIPF